MPMNVLLSSLFIYLFLTDRCGSVLNLMRKRVPSVADPGLGIRLSEDSQLTEAEIEMAKKKGPNMCVKRLFKNRSDSRHYCDVSMGRYICRRPKPLFYTVYRCCPGFRKQLGEKGCPKEEHWSSRHALKALHQLGLSAFLELTRQAYLQRFVKEQKSITLLVPSNEALKKWKKSKTGRRIVKNNYLLRLTLLNHIVGGKWPSVFLKDLDRLETIQPSKSRQLRVKFFRGKKIMTVEGALVTQRDISASNAVIHVVDSVIYPPKSTIRELLSGTPELSSFHEAFRRYQYKIPDRTTIFAPRNEAFQQLNEDTKMRLYERLQCLQELVFIHVVENIIYLPVLKIMNRPSIVTVQGNRLTFELHKGILTINGVALKSRFVGARDGAIYIIDKLLTPTSALTIMDILQNIPNVVMTNRLLERYNLSAELNQQISNTTLFVPYDSVFLSPKGPFQRLMDNTDQGLQFLQYHMTPGTLGTDRMYNDQLIPTFNSKDMLRINTYHVRRTVAVQGSCLDFSRKDIKACNGMIHVLNGNYLTPAKGTILDIIVAHPKLTVLKSAVQKVGLFPLLSANTPLTLFAPTDEAWRKLQGFQLYHFFEDVEKLSDTVRYHIIPTSLYHCGLGRRRKYRSLNGRAVRITRSKEGIGFNYAKTIIKDISATNGVVHVVDSLVMYLSKEVLSGYG